jgi:hypothetical protein
MHGSLFNLEDVDILHRDRVGQRLPEILCGLPFVLLCSRNNKPAYVRSLHDMRGAHEKSMRATSLGLAGRNTRSKAPREGSII